MSNTSLFNKTLPFVVYVPPNVVERARGTPRFGRTQDIAVLVGTNDQAKKEYAVGVSIAGIIIVCVFVVWALLLLVCLCGRRKFGFLGGRRFERMITLKEEQESLKQRQARALKDAGMDEGTVYSDNFDNTWRDESHEQERERRAATFSHKGFCGGRPTQVRIAYLLSGIIFVIATILAITKGLNHLQQTIVSLDNTALQTHNLTQSAITLLEDSQQRVGAVAEQLRTNLQSQINAGSFCPANAALDTSSIGEEIQSQANTAVDLLAQVRDLFGDNVAEISDSLYQANQLSLDINEHLQGIDLNSWQALLVLIPYLVLPVLLMMGVVLALCEVHVGWYSCLLSWVVTPLFIIFVMVAWAVAAGMLIMAGIEGDFCLPGGRVAVNQQVASSQYRINSPDITVNNLLNAAQINGTDTYKIAQYYTTQCQVGSNPLAFVNEQLPQVEQGQASVRQLEALLSNSDAIRDLSLICSRDFSDFQALVFDLDGVISSLLQAAGQALDLIACARIIPLYTGFVYDGMCTYSASAVHWVYGCAITIAVFGMIMLTLRASYKMTAFVLAPYESADDFGKVRQDSVNHNIFDAATVKDDVVIHEVEPNSHGHEYPTKENQSDEYVERYDDEQPTPQY